MKKDLDVAFKPETAAEAYLGRLAARGVDYLFANGGTDFAPIVEAYAKGQALGWRMPEPVIVPHENMGVAMMHGYTMVTGRAQAMMVHVGMGTANSINGLINAARMNIPMLFTAGRTPLTESGAVPGARNNYIHWAQEHFDQGGMLREFMKWDYELKHAEQVDTAVDRALAIAGSEPQGPVYLTLPREVGGPPGCRFPTGGGCRRARRSSPLAGARAAPAIDHCQWRPDSGYGESDRSPFRDIRHPGGALPAALSGAADRAPDERGLGAPRAA